MSKWIKNVDTIDHTWAGQTINAGAYYEIDANELISFQNNSELLVDIAAGIAIIAYDDSGTRDISDVSKAIDFLKDIVNIARTSLNFQKVSVYEPEGFFKSYVSHNLCDRTTWYEKSVQVTSETLTLDTGLIYDFANQNLIDVEHGKITGEKNFSLDFTTFTYTQTLRDKYKVTIYDDGVAMTSGYTIDYIAGKVTLDSSPSGVLTADYYYENGSCFTVMASGANKILQIRHVEIQFTNDIAFNSSIVQAVRAYNPLDLPNKIDVEHIEFLNEYDVINIGNEGKGVISKYGNIPFDINVFPFAYGRTIDLKSSQGSEIAVCLEDDIPMSGTFATVTFYTTEEDEE